jgi:hypothetical protein
MSPYITFEAFGLTLCLGYMLNRWHHGNHEPWRLFAIIMLTGIVIVLLFCS